MWINNWFVKEDMYNISLTEKALQDAHVFYIQQPGMTHQFVGISRYFDHLKEVYPLLNRVDNNPNYNFRALIARQMKQHVPFGEKITIMNRDEAEDAALVDDPELMTMLEKQGYELVDLGWASVIDMNFRLYQVSPMEAPARLIRKETNFTQYLKYINDQRYSVLIAARDDASKSLTNKHLSALAGLGLQKSLKNQDHIPYLAVIDKGLVVYEALGISKKDLLTYHGILADGALFSLTSAWNTPLTSIFFDGADYAINGRGLNFVVYDNETGRIVDSATFDTYLPHIPVYRKNNL
ncbi:MAG: hypothetical protein LBB48_01955 [Treponema sp.]|nr:hypothetical protein [Treponema sp.]